MSPNQKPSNNFITITLFVVGGLLGILQITSLAFLNNVLNHIEKIDDRQFNMNQKISMIEGSLKNKVVSLNPDSSGIGVYPSGPNDRLVSTNDPPTQVSVAGNQPASDRQR